LSAFIVSNAVDCAAADQGDNLVRTQKPVPVNEPENFKVTFNQPDGRNFGGALKTRESRHPTSMAGTPSN
jgi:hypothetical protein